MRPTLLIAESQDFSSQARAILESYFDVTSKNLDRQDLLQSVADCKVLWVRLRTMIDVEVMNAAPALKIIATNTTGLNHIDGMAAKDRGIRVVSLQGETEFLKTIRATAEHTIALALSLLRKIPTAHADVCSGRWDRTDFQGSELYEKTVGIIGYGRLGSIVAQYFHAFGCNVQVHSRELPVRGEVDGFATVTLPQLLGNSDIVSLHVNDEPKNHHMLAAEHFSQMKRGAYFINTARGELVDQEALLDAVESRHLGGAAVDVIDHEHVHGSSFSRLAKLAATSDRLLVTPHIAGFTHESLSKTETFLAEKLIATMARDSPIKK